MLMCDTSTAVRIKTAATLGRFTEVDAVSVTGSNISDFFRHNLSCV